MFKLALKNLWNRRGRYGWLFAELIIAAVVSWFAIDHLVVSYAYMSNIDYGYDHDRLLLIDMAESGFDGTPFDLDRDDFDSRSTDFAIIMDKVAEVDGVESVTRIPGPFLEGMYGATSIPLNDTTYCFTARVGFIPSTRYFSTYGIARADVAGNPSLEELDNLSLSPGEAIVTRSVAELLYGDAAASFAASRNVDSNALPLIIRGIVEDVVPRTNNTTRCAIFQSVNSPGGSFILVRAEPGVKVADLVDPLNELGISGALDCGNYRYRNIMTYQTVTDQLVGDQNMEFFTRLFAFFCLLNLFLGVLGSFWLMTRKRSEEMGIVRSFGFTPAAVRRQLMVEGAVLTVVSWLIGTAIFFYFILSEGPYAAFFDADMPSSMAFAIWGTGDSIFDVRTNNLYFPNWVFDVWRHFAVSSFATLSVLMVVVLTGIAVPAWKLSRVNPVDALRCE